MFIRIAATGRTSRLKTQTNIATKKSANEDLKASCFQRQEYILDQQTTTMEETKPLGLTAYRVWQKQ